MRHLVEHDVRIGDLLARTTAMVQKTNIAIEETLARIIFSEQLISDSQQIVMENNFKRFVGSDFTIS
jgi:hypothetical protein